MQARKKLNLHSKNKARKNNLLHFDSILVNLMYIFSKRGKNESYTNLTSPLSTVKSKLFFLTKAGKQLFFLTLKASFLIDSLEPDYE